MHNLKISVSTLTLLLVLLYLHKYAIAYHLYTQYWFYDIIMHFLGGVGLAMSFYCITIFFNIRSIKDNLWKIIILTLIAGIVWELFEIKYDLIGSPFGTIKYNIDTIKDLIMDTLGAVFVWRIIRSNNKNDEYKHNVL